MLKQAFLKLSDLACTLPEHVGRSCAGAIGLLAAKAAGTQKKQLIETIDRVYHRFGKTPPRPMEQIVDQLYVHFALNAYEMLRAPIYSSPMLEKTFEFEGWEHVDEALQRKKGLILVVPHIGNWELLGAAIAFRGYKLHSFYMAQKENDLGALLDHLRGHFRIRLHDRDRAGIGGLKALKSGEVLGMIADQDGGNLAIYGDFLRHWVSIPAGPANWSLKTGAPIIPLYSLRIGRTARYRAKFFPPLPEEHGSDHEERMIQRTRRILDWMEPIILEHPHQYLWFYDRFRPRHEGHIARLKKAGLVMRHGEMVYGGGSPRAPDAPPARSL
jgi:KDO2-lipid IV(A) lauroyltransferase